MHILTLTRGSVLCRLGKSVSAGVADQGLPLDSMSTDDGIGTTVSPSDTHAVHDIDCQTPVPDSRDNDHMTEADSGYDIAAQSSLRSQAESAGSESTGGQDDEEVPIMRTETEATARCSPPPTYCHLFRTSTAAAIPSICTSTPTICTHEQLHVTGGHDERFRQREAGGCLSACDYPSVHPLFRSLSFHRLHALPDFSDTGLKRLPYKSIHLVD